MGEVVVVVVVVVVGLVVLKTLQLEHNQSNTRGMHPCQTQSHSHAFLNSRGRCASRRGGCSESKVRKRVKPTWL